MRVVFFETEEWEKGYLSDRLAGHELAFEGGIFSDETAAAAAQADVLSVFVNSHVTREALAQLPNLKLVVTRSMGYDHIDLEACAQRGVAVTRVPSYGDRTVAEHAFALILALSRKIFLAYERTEKGIFDYRGLQGFDLFGKTIGVIGGGKIGLNVVRMARGFGMHALVHDPFPRPELAADIGFTYVEFPELLRRSDVISLHAPLTPDTHHLINEQSIGLIKRGAILVNTARGALIDTRALLKALEQGILSGAGLDVLEEECAVREEKELLSKDFADSCDLATLMRNHLLIERNDVIITPHNAFNSREAVERILATTVENVESFAKGKTVNAVTK